MKLIEITPSGEEILLRANISDDYANDLKDFLTKIVSRSNNPPRYYVMGDSYIIDYNKGAIA